MTNQSLSDEMVGLTGILRGSFQPQQWLRALIVEYGKLDNEDVDNMSDSLYDWCEEGMKAKNSNTPITMFPDYEEPPAPAEEEPKSETATPTPVSDKEKGGPTYKYREILLENWGLSREAVTRIAEAQGIHLASGSIAGLNYHTKQTVAIIEKCFSYKLPLAGQRRRARNKSKD